MKKFSITEFRDAARRGDPPADCVIMRDAVASPEAVPSESRTLRFVFSDSSVDREGDIIDANGWDLVPFAKNPVALFSHITWEPPVGRCKNVLVKDNKLVGDIEFASAETYAFADTIFRLVKEKFLRAVSVGFKPLSWNLSGDPKRPGGLDFKKQELLEISIVAVPANPHALAEARAKNIDLSDPRLLPMLKSGPQMLLSEAARRRLRVAEAHEIAAQARALAGESSR